MKVGLSILLTEIVDAIQLEYGDCQEFQVVCPECMEPVFKKTRTENDCTSHFLSHYKSSADNQLCENRVASYTRESIQRFNAIARGQNLDEFVAYLPSLMLEFTSTLDNAKMSELIDDRLKSNEFKQVIADFHEQFNRKNIREMAVSLAKNFYTKEYLLQNFADSEKFTPMYVEKQLQIANAFFDYFNTAPGRKTFAWVTAYMVAAAHLSYEIRDINDPEWFTKEEPFDMTEHAFNSVVNNVVPALKTLAFTKGLKLKNEIVRMKKQPLKSGDRLHVSLRIYEFTMLELASKLIKTMIHLPYIDLLKKKSSNTKLIKPTLN